VIQEPKIARTYDVLHRMEKLRTYINESRIKYLLIQNKITFDQLIACMDCIEDTEEAIIDYEGRSTFKDQDYIALYGLLQVLFVQQDALSHLNFTLLKKELKLQEDYPELWNIRIIRNLSTGHPTGNRYKTFNQIVRSSLRKESYRLVTRYHDKETTSQEINLINLIQVQRKCILQHLDFIVHHMKTEYEKHKNRFKDQPLMSELPPAFDYFITKLYEPDLTMAKAHQTLLLNILENVKAGIIVRYESLDARISFKYLYDELNFALVRLGELITSSSHNEINVYATFTKLKFTELKEMITEVDREFTE
jgi:hypothetical protein